MHARQEDTFFLQIKSLLFDKRNKTDSLLASKLGRD